MSLVGFKARNHTQQVARRGANPKVDDRATAPEVFGPLHERFNFTIDVAALPHNAKLPRYFTPEQVTSQEYVASIKAQTMREIDAHLGKRLLGDHGVCPHCGAPKRTRRWR